MLTFTVERASEYQQGYGKYPYTPEELAGARYVLTLNNGDSHLLHSAADIEALVSGELYLAGFGDEPDSSEEA